MLSMMMSLLTKHCDIIVNINKYRIGYSEKNKKMVKWQQIVRIKKKEKQTPSRLKKNYHLKKIRKWLKMLMWGKNRHTKHAAKHFSEIDKKTLHQLHEQYGRMNNWFLCRIAVTNILTPKNYKQKTKNSKRSVSIDFWFNSPSKSKPNIWSAIQRPYRISYNTRRSD